MAKTTATTSTSKRRKNTIPVPEKWVKAVTYLSPEIYDRIVKLSNEQSIPPEIIIATRVASHFMAIPTAEGSCIRDFIEDTKEG